VQVFLARAQCPRGVLFLYAPLFPNSGRIREIRTLISIEADAMSITVKA
jgi:hypothetical protein